MTIRTNLGATKYKADKYWGLVEQKGPWQSTPFDKKRANEYEERKAGGGIGIQENKGNANARSIINPYTVDATPTSSTTLKQKSIVYQKMYEKKKLGALGSRPISNEQVGIEKLLKPLLEKEKHTYPSYPLPLKKDDSIDVKQELKTIPGNYPLELLPTTFDMDIDITENDLRPSKKREREEYDKKTKKIKKPNEGISIIPRKREQEEMYPKGKKFKKPDSAISILPTKRKTEQNVKENVKKSKMNPKFDLADLKKPEKANPGVKRKGGEKQPYRIAKKPNTKDKPAKLRINVSNLPDSAQGGIKKGRAENKSAPKKFDQLPTVKPKRK